MMEETLNVSGALLVKLFGRTMSEVLRFSERAARVRRAGVRQALLMRWFFLTVGLISAVGTALVFWAGGMLVLQGTFTLGTVVAFTAYLGMLYGPLSALTNARVDFATSMVSFERVFEALDLPEEIAEPADALRLGIGAGLGPVRGRLVQLSTGRKRARRGGGAGRGGALRQGPRRIAAAFVAGERRAEDRAAEKRACRRCQPAGDDAEGADAARADGDTRYALSDVSFEVKPGRLAALVGPSGAGKTTVTYLLPRLYDPTAGAIRIDGHDIRELTLDTLASQIGMVTQETYLFNDTHPGQPALCPARRDRRADRGCLPGGQHPRLHRRPAGRLRHDRRQPRLSPLRRREAADGHRPRHPQGPEDPGAGRGHVIAGQPVGGADPGGAGADHGGSDQPGDRAPAQHHPLGGHDPGAGSRSSGGAGHPRRAAGARRAVR